MKNNDDFLGPLFDLDDDGHIDIAEEFLAYKTYQMMTEDDDDQYYVPKKKRGPLIKSISCALDWR